MKINKLLICFILILLPISNLFSQLDKRLYHSYGDRFYSEIIILPHSDSDSMTVVSMVELMHSMLQFNQINSPNELAFKSPINLDFIFKDKTGIIRKRSFFNDTAFASTYESTISRDKFYRLVKTFNLKKENYEMKLESSSGSKKISKKTAINLPKETDNIIIFNPIYTKSDDMNTVSEIEPSLLGNAINFTSDGGRILVPISYKDENISFTYTINNKRDYETDDYWQPNVNISSSANLRTNKMLELEEEYLPNKIYYEMVNNETLNDGSRVGLIDIELPANVFVPGKYKLSIKEQSRKEINEFDFKVIWTNKPISLNKIDYAIELMYYILTDNEYNEMKKGNDNEQIQKFMKYWKTLDPTPLTPFNEALEQYFTRVDYAFFNLQSLAEQDGAKTDRGKIYILYGRPSSITPSMANSKPQEIWTYENLNKTFTFEAVRSGVYKLVKIDG